MQLPARPAGRSNEGKTARGRGTAAPGGGRRSILRTLRAWLATLSSLGRGPLQGPVRVALLAAIPLALVVTGLVGALSASGGVHLRSLEQHQSNADTSRERSSLLGQSFRSSRPNLSRIDVQMATYPDLQGAGSVNLLQGDGLHGTVVYSAPLSSARFSRDPFLSVEFPPVSGSEGITYTLVFETPGLAVGERLGVRYSTFDLLSSGRMYTGDGPQPGDLIISLHYSYTLGDLLADTLSTLAGEAWQIIAWALLLLLPGLALLAWLPSGLQWGQRVLAAPGLTALAMPVLLLVMRALGLPLGTIGMWAVAGLSLLALLGQFIKVRGARTGGAAGAKRSPLGAAIRQWARAVPGADLLFWVSLLLIFGATLAVRLMSLRDAAAGMGLDAYHHTLISGLILEKGGIPTGYEPYAPLDSFTYHYGFHALVSALGWIVGAGGPQEMMLLMPQVGQLSTALPVLTLTLFGWRALNNRWAGLFAGALAGLVCVMPAYYVNWSRYAQGLGLALLPVAWLLVTRLLERPERRTAEVGQTAGQGPAVPVPSRALSAVEQSGPYALAVVAAAGLFLTHYRIAMLFALLLALYLPARLAATLWRRARPSSGAAPVAAQDRAISTTTLVRRAAILAGLTLAAISPWLVNLSQNFRSHLVGRETDESRAYYDLSGMEGLLKHGSMWLLYVLGAVGLALALRRRSFSPPLVLVAAAWALAGVWSNPYLLAWLIPGFRLPYSGYLDVNTWAQTLWLPLALLAGYAFAIGGEAALRLGNTLRGVAARAWRTGVRSLALASSLLVMLAVAMPVAANVDGKPYISPADREALVWMRANLPRDAYVLANPFAFGWAPANVYGSDAGMWVPYVAGVRASVPPLPAYNERPADPDYLGNVIEIVQHEPFVGEEMSDDDWAYLEQAGVTHIFIGSRGGALDAQGLLLSDRVRLLFHKDGVYIFAIR